MRIRSLRIENFRAIRILDLVDLPDAVVIAGANGCGKSSVFDAIRLLKSAYGQYNQNEFQQWFSEAQINIQRIGQEARRALYDPEAPLFIKAVFELAKTEHSYLAKNAERLIEKLTWAEVSPNLPGPGARTPNPAFRRGREPTIKEAVRKKSKSLQQELKRGKFVAELTMSPEGDVKIANSAVLELAFSMFSPRDLGIIDYHSPHRSYVREQLGGINLNIADASQQYSQHALYNTQNKYTNVKSEMARSYIQDLLAKEAGIPAPGDGDLIKTLHELFNAFFPGKQFLGVIPTPDGSIAFPVRLENGREHDINELSSGEKEVLLGYLRLRNSAPSNSIILLDEPELHLNPRLIRGLPRFYQEHLGARLGNQLWLITHSDALLREAVDEPTYAVYHMEAAHLLPSGTNQLHSIDATAEMERALVDLVGDLATYNPDSKVVLLEGGGASEFDAALVQRLFPSFAERVNLISGGSKRRVAEMHDLLDAASRKGKLGAKFFSIVDRDFDGPNQAQAERRFVWDVYHVENYLLEPRSIRDVIKSLEMVAEVPTISDIEKKLKSCAAQTVDDLVRIKMESHVNKVMVNCIGTRFDPKLGVAKGFRAAAERSRSGLDRALNEELSPEALTILEQRARKELAAALAENRWKVEFRGRDILGRFSNELGISYERFRNLVANRMAELGHEPDGMKRIITEIMSETK
jgi:energy-coupling factor transporter ATP-binding protein EcfA2